MGWRRDVGAATLAVLGHSAAVVSLARGERSRIVAEAEPSSIAISIESESTPAEETADPHQGQGLGTARVAASPARAPAFSPQLGEKGAESSLRQPTSEASPEVSFVFDPSVPDSISPETLGLGASNPFLGHHLAGVDEPTPKGPPSANAAPGIERSIHDALAAHDHAIGLDEGGPLIGVAEEVTQPSDAPLDGLCVLEVIVDPGGAVRSARVVDVNKDRTAWQKVVAQFVATAKARGALLRPSRTARRITLEVSSRWGLPSGSHPGRPITQPFVKLDPGATVQDDQPRSSVAAGGHFDISDIGARPIRDVHARVLSEGPL